MLRSVCLSFLLTALLAIPVSSQAPPQPPVLKGQAVATWFSGYVSNNPANGIKNDPVVAIVDVHNPIAYPTLWTPPMYYGPANSWRPSNLGQVFGIAIDKRRNVYVTATAVYGSFTDPMAFGPAGSGAIYRLDGMTGVISNASGAAGNFVTTAPSTTSPASAVGTGAIPNGNGTNNRPGLGNICYAPLHDRLYVTNIEDGVIYRINPLTGLIDAYYDPVAPAGPGGTSNPAMVIDNGTLGPAPLGDRIWGIGYNRLTNRIYYAVWVEDYGNGGPTVNNVIRSVALDGTGNFQPATDRLEVVVPDPAAYHPNTNNPNGRSAPIADIAFNSVGRMLLAERTMYSATNPGAHASRVLEYGGAYPAWTGPTQTFVGNPVGTIAGQNAAGGVDYGYSGWDAKLRTPTGCDSVIWSTGDLFITVAGFGSLYGLQRSPASGNTLATLLTTGFFIDLNGLGSAQSYDKTQVGDVEIYRTPCDSTPPRKPNCDSLRIALKKDNTYGQGACCWSITLTNNDPGTIYTQISATVTTPSVTISNATAPAGWMVGGTGTTATWNAPPTGVPSGTTTGLTFCLNIGLTPPPQSLTFTWTTADGQTCTTEVQVDCSPPAPVPGCASLQKVDIACKQSANGGNSYQMNFQIHNESVFYVISGATIVSVTPTGLGVAPTNFTFGGGIPTNGTSTMQTLSIFGPLAKPGDTVCLTFELFNAEMTWCCKFDTCFILPPCPDCCDDTRIRIQNEGQGGVGLSHNGMGTTTVSNLLTVSPKKIIAASATVVSAHLRRYGSTLCKPTYGWIPISGEIVSPQSTLGGLPLNLAPQPFNLPPPPNYREAIWGTVPSGVSFTAPVPINLQIAFPAPPPPFGHCYDVIRFCVRYSFTDTACVTCDTIICYEQKRVGSVIVCCPGGNPSTIKGRLASIRMSSPTEGRLTVRLPALSPEAMPEEAVRITGIRLAPAVHVRLVSFGGVTARDNVAAVPTSIAQGDSMSFDVTFDNYGAVRSWANSVTYRYVRVGTPNETMEGEETVTARVPGDIGGDSLAQDRESLRPTGVRTFMLYFANSNPLYEETRSITIRPLYEGRILAVGPPPSDSGLITLVPTGDSGSVTFTPSGGDTQVVAGSTVRPIYLTLSNADSGTVITLEYATYNTSGEEVARGVLTLDDPLSTADIDGNPAEAATGGDLLLWPIAPNPGATDRVVHFRLPRPDEADLVVYDAAGREVRAIIDGAWLPQGDHVVVLRTEGLASGSYYVVLRTSSASQSVMMQMVR